MDIPSLSVAERPPWFRQQGESPKAYAAFCCYRDLGVKRTVIDAHRKHTGNERINRDYQATSHLNAWHKQWNWDARAKAYDDHTEMVETVKKDNLASDKAVIWQKRKDELREEKFELGKLMFSQAREILEYPVREVTIEEDEKTYIVKPTKWIDKSVAATLAKAGCDLTSELSSIKIDVSMEPGEDQPDLSRLSEEELKSLRSLLETASKKEVA